ncbi:MAG: glycosyltransferase family 2 protein [Litorimonas sp.]
MRVSLTEISDQPMGCVVTHERVPDVMIAIPTFQRSTELVRVLGTTLARVGTRYKASLLVVDNNPKPQEKDVVESFAATSAIDVHYIHEPLPGVSNARNAAIAFAKTRYLAFLDDDMEVTSDWLDELVDTALQSGFGVIFGPIVARFEDVADPRNPYLSPFYSRTLENQPTIEIKKPFGTGGCLIDLSQGERPNPPFDPELNESGGEDDIFFSALKKSGVQFGWAQKALCFENVPDHRITTSYILRRNFGYGQAPTRLAAGKGLSGLPQIARHMIIGAAQFGVYGSFYVAAKVLNRPSSVRYLALTARGFGKVFWADRFQQKLYGVSQLDNN